jgi:hypothetical protein
MSWFVPVERRVDEWRPLPIDTGKGLGVVVFDSWRDARTFIEANWEPSLGPGWEPKELDSAQLAHVLERLADGENAEWVVKNPPPLVEGFPWGAEGAPPMAVVMVANVREFIEALRGSN